MYLIRTYQDDFIYCSICPFPSIKSRVIRRLSHLAEAIRLGPAIRIKLRTPHSFPLFHHGLLPCKSSAKQRPSRGLSASGSWGCFDEFNRLVPEVLSVCTVQFKAQSTARNRACGSSLYGLTTAKRRCFQLEKRPVDD